MQAKTPKAARLVLAVSVLVLCVLVFCGCGALTGYQERVNQSTMEWEREKALLVKEMDDDKISKEQYLAERQALDKAFREELAAATKEFKEDAKAEAKMAAEGALNPWGIGASVLGSILAGWGATRASRKYTESEDTRMDTERDRRRAARGERVEAIETVEKKPA